MPLSGREGRAGGTEIASLLRKRKRGATSEVRKAKATWEYFECKREGSGLGEHGGGFAAKCKIGACDGPGWPILNCS